jgi:hypothetical protein
MEAALKKDEAVQKAKAALAKTGTKSEKVAKAPKIEKQPKEPKAAKPKFDAEECIKDLSKGQIVRIHNIWGAQEHNVSGIFDRKLDDGNYLFSVKNCPFIMSKEDMLSTLKSKLTVTGEPKYDDLMLRKHFSNAEYEKLDSQKNRIPELYARVKDALHKKEEVKEEK